LFKNVKDGNIFDIMILKMLNIYEENRPSSTQLICNEIFDSFEISDGYIHSLNLNSIEHKIKTTTTKTFKSSFMKICDREKLSYSLFKKIVYAVKYWKSTLKNSSMRCESCYLGNKEDRTHLCTEARHIMNLFNSCRINNNSNGYTINDDICFSIWLCKQMCNVHYRNCETNQQYEELCEHFIKFYNYKIIL
jgi:hypothetical protein